MAVAVIFIILGGYFEGSTLFLLAAASFLAGVVEKNFSVAAAAVFCIGSTFLGILLAPQKLYCVTFAVFCIYVMAAEFLENRRMSLPSGKRAAGIWAIKGLVYHVLLLLSLFFAGKLFGFEGILKGRWAAALSQYRILFGLVLFACAELFWLVFDRAYLFFQRHYGHYFLWREE